MKELIQRSLVLNKEIENVKLEIKKEILNISSITNRLQSRLEHLERIVSTQNEFLRNFLTEDILSEVGLIRKDAKEKPSHEGHDYQPTHDH